MQHAPAPLDFSALLSQVPLFEGMKPQAMTRITRAALKLQVNRGDTLFQKDEISTGLYVIVSGQVKVFVSTQQGNEKVLNILGQGKTLCEATMFLGGTYQTYAQALSKCVLLRISKQCIMAELERDPALARNAIASLSQQIIDRNMEIKSYALHSGRQRVIGYLLSEMARTQNIGCHIAAGITDGLKEGSESSFHISLPARKSVIASCLTLSIEHFSRILHELSDCGLILIDGRDIRVIDIEKLGIGASQSKPIAIQSPETCC